MAEHDLVYAGIQLKRIDVREQAIQKIWPKPGCLFLVKMPALDQVLLGVIEDLDSHETLRRIFFLAVSQSA